MYVISVKRVRSYTGEKLSEKDQYFEYAMFDKYSGSFSTGNPCFGRIKRAEIFNTIGEAKKWYEDYKRIVPANVIKYDRQNNYDFSTLAIREIKIKKVCSLYI